MIREAAFLFRVDEAEVAHHSGARLEQWPHLQNSFGNPQVLRLTWDRKNAEEMGARSARSEGCSPRRKKSNQDRFGLAELGVKGVWSEVADCVWK